MAPNLKDGVLKAGFADQASLLFVTVRGEGYFYMSDDKVGFGFSGGKGITSQVAGASATCFLGVVDKAYSDDSTVVVSFAANVGSNRVAGASLDLGNDSFNGFSIEYGITASVNRYELSVLEMKEKKW